MGMLDRLQDVFRDSDHNLWWVRVWLGGPESDFNFFYIY